MIVQKLNYLTETRNLIKQALQEKGETVLDTDTFRSYADKIRGMHIGPDVSDATAVESDILEDKTAYIATRKSYRNYAK